MKKVIVCDLGGVYFTEGTGIALKKIKKMLSATDKKIEEVIRASPGKEGHLYRKGKLTKKQFWNKAVKKLGFKRKLVPKIQKVWHSSYKPIKGTVKIIKKIRKNYKVVVLSGTIRERKVYFNKKYNLNKKFDGFYFSYSLGYRKKERKMYVEFLKRSKLKAKNCIFIDDKKTSIKNAKSVGMKTILFKNPKQLKRELTKLGIRV